MTVHKQNSALWQNSITLLLCILSIYVLTIDNVSFSRFFYEGMITSAKRIAPVLFPFILTSGIIINSGALNALSDLMHPIFIKKKINPNVIQACIPGIICGFPVGARCIRELHQNSQITKKEADVMLIGTNCASPAFVICAIGKTLYNSTLLGLYMWVISTLTSVFIMFLLLPKSREKAYAQQRTQSKAISTVFCESISKATYSTISICAIISFFFMLTSYLKAYLASINTPKALICLICALLEISSGCSACAELLGEYSLTFCAFAIGFGGVCVYTQVKSEAHDYADMRFYILGKTVCGLICSLFMFLVL